jgi:hypothetical protein
VLSSVIFNFVLEFNARKLNKSSKDGKEKAEFLFSPSSIIVHTKNSKQSPKDSTINDRILKIHST